MTDVRSEDQHSVPSHDGQAYEPPCMRDLDGAAGTTEAASMAIPPSSS